VAPEQERFNLVFIDRLQQGFVAPALKALRDGGWLDKHALVSSRKAQVQAWICRKVLFPRTRRFADTQAVFATFD